MKRSDRIHCPLTCPLILGLLIFILNGNAFSQAEIKKSLPVSASHNPKFNIKDAPAPLFRDPVFDGAADPTVIWDSRQHAWLIFYTARRARLDLNGVAYCYGTAIGMAASFDYGKTWTYKGTAHLPQPDTGLNSFWAPQVFQNPKDKVYHMLVSYIKGVYEDWGGERQIFHYTSTDLKEWKVLPSTGLVGCIDASAYPLPDGSWKMWYKNEAKGSYTYAAKSSDLIHWKVLDSAEITNRHHEAPIVFYWKKAYWMVTDPTYEEYTGLDVFRSTDATHWVFNNTILDHPGARPDDIDQGRHPDVKVVDGKAYIFYFTHPGRVYPGLGKEDPDANRYRYRRSSLQVAELELIDGKIACDRNKYALLKGNRAFSIPQ